MNHPSTRVILQTDNSSRYKSEDEFGRMMCLDINRSTDNDGCRSLARVHYDLSNMAAVLALIMNKDREQEIDITVYQRGAYSVSCMPEPETIFFCQARQKIGRQENMR